MLHAHRVFVQRFSKRDGRAAGKAVRPGCGQHQRVSAEMNRLQTQCVDLARHDANVGPAVQHPARNFSVRFFLKVDIDAGVGVQEVGQNFRQKICHGGGVGKHPDMAPQAAAVLPHVGAQLFGLAQHALGVVQKCFACRGQAHAACFAVQQGHPRLLFQALDPGTGRCEGQVAPGGRPRQVAGLRRHDKKAQISQVKVHGQW